MRIDTKKELLKYILLKESEPYEFLSYKLIGSKFLQDTISNISDLSITHNIDIQDENINAKQFLNLLNRFVHEFDILFYNIHTTETNITNVFEANIDKINEFFSLKCNIWKDETIVKEKAYKIIISNFINNSKYIPSLKKLLNEIGIEIKNIDDYTFDECYKIVNLLSNISFCTRRRNWNECLFENIDFRTNKHVKMQMEKPKHKHDEKYYRDCYISRYIKIYNEIIDTYNNKKKYLKYFN